ncbi:VWA domain-containing protein [Micrococcus luteus]|nr:VWA domain-containing protein [Micrococcus luteus]
MTHPRTAPAPLAAVAGSLGLCLSAAVLAGAPALAAPTSTPAAGQARQQPVVVMDHSGSMLNADADAEGTTRVDAAKAATKDLIRAAPGETPVSAALQQAADALEEKEKGTIVLVSDGQPSCDTPPACEDAAQLTEHLTTRTTRALHGYEAAGTPITGGSSLAEAPLLLPGPATDTLASHARPEQIGHRLGTDDFADGDVTGLPQEAGPGFLTTAAQFRERFPDEAAAAPPPGPGPWTPSACSPWPAAPS